MDETFDDEIIDELEEDEIDDVIDEDLDEDIEIDADLDTDLDEIDAIDEVDLVDDLQPTDIELPLDALIDERVLNPALDEDDEDEIIDEITGEPIKVVPRKANEFVCQSCFLVFQTRMMADKKNQLCKDCA